MFRVVIFSLLLSIGISSAFGAKFPERSASGMDLLRIICEKPLVEKQFDQEAYARWSAKLAQAEGATEFDRFLLNVRALPEVSRRLLKFRYGVIKEFKELTLDQAYRGLGIFAKESDENQKVAWNSIRGSLSERSISRNRFKYFVKDNSDLLIEFSNFANEIPLTFNLLEESPELFYAGQKLSTEKVIAISQWAGRKAERVAVLEYILNVGAAVSPQEVQNYINELEAAPTVPIAVFVEQIRNLDRSSEPSEVRTKIEQYVSRNALHFSVDQLMVLAEATPYKYEAISFYFEETLPKMNIVQLGKLIRSLKSRLAVAEMVEKFAVYHSKRIMKMVTPGKIIRLNERSVTPAGKVYWTLKIGVGDGKFHLFQVHAKTFEEAVVLAELDEQYRFAQQDTLISEIMARTDSWKPKTGAAPSNPGFSGKIEKTYGNYYVSPKRPTTSRGPQPIFIDNVQGWFSVHYSPSSPLLEGTEVAHEFLQKFCPDRNAYEVHGKIIIADSAEGAAWIAGQVWRRESIQNFDAEKGIEVRIIQISN